MSTTSLVEKMQGIQEFESRVKALVEPVWIEILDPYEDEDAVAKVYMSDRELSDTIHDIAIDIEDQTGVRIVPMIIYKSAEDLNK